MLCADMSWAENYARISKKGKLFVLGKPCKQKQASGRTFTTVFGLLLFCFVLFLCALLLCWLKNWHSVFFFFFHRPLCWTHCTATRSLCSAWSCCVSVCYVELTSECVRLQCIQCWSCCGFNEALPVFFFLLLHFFSMHACVAVFLLMVVACFIW